MRILVTGCLGLIGSEITSQLVAQGHEVIGTDDESHPAITWDECKAPVQIVSDCVEVSSVTAFMEMIIHCASPVGHAMLRPEAQTAWKIVRDTQAMLELAQAAKARLITMSSSEVLTYKGETDIRAQYALGKLTSESMVLGHPSVHGHVIRPYNVTGRHQRNDGGFVMPRFRDQALAGQPLEVFGSGEQTRHFTHVSDFARFVLALVEKWPAPKGRWCVFNPKNRTTINQLGLEFVRQRSGYDPKALCLIQRNGAQVLKNPHWRDSSERPIDLSEYEACRALGWEPRVTLQQIVREHLTDELAMTKGGQP